MQILGALTALQAQALLLGEFSSYCLPDSL